MNELFEQIESILVKAGEECVEDYQSDLNWVKYWNAIALVKLAVRKFIVDNYPLV